MRYYAIVLTAFLAVTLPAAPAALSGALEQSIPWHERSIESRKGKIAEYETIIHEYDAELRKLESNAPETPKRRTEIRIIKKYYNDEIKGLKERIIEHYKAIMDLKAKQGATSQ